jgi:hypothetical protein
MDIKFEFMNVIANLKVNPETKKVIPVKGVDYSIKKTTFRLRIFNERRIRYLDVVAKKRSQAINDLKDCGYCYAY